MSVQIADGLEEMIGWERTTDEEPLGGAPTILYVEDETFVREVTCEVLRSAGYNVLTAKNAVEAQRIYEGQRAEIDLLLTDVVLPGETGRALAGKLRRKDPALRVLFVTGYAEHMRLGETEYEECLAKPFSTKALLGRVRRMLDGDGSWAGEGEWVTLACGNA